VTTNIKVLVLTGNLHYIVPTYWKLYIKSLHFTATDFEFVQFPGN